MRKEEFNDAISIATKRTVDAWIEQNEILDGLTIEEYRRLLEDSSDFTQSLYINLDPDSDPLGRADFTYTTNKAMDCGKNEHTHNEDCYDENDVLICNLEEHTHSESCYSTGSRKEIKVIEAIVTKNPNLEGFEGGSIHEVNIETNPDYKVTKVTYLADGFENDAKMLEEIDADLTDENEETDINRYKYGFSLESNYKAIDVIVYYEKIVEIERYEDLEPLFFYDNDEFVQFFIDNVEIQLKSGQVLVYETKNVNVDVGKLEIAVTSKFKDMAGKERELTAVAETYSKIYPNKTFLDPVVAVQREGSVNKRTYKDVLKSVDLVAGDGTISSTLTNLVSSNHFVEPVPDSSISAYPWYYPQSFGGTYHLGTDYAAIKGTEIYAPANGVVVVSSNGCGDGQLGDSCAGDNPYAVGYGGNQITMIVRIENSIDSNVKDGFYAFTFFHMLNLPNHNEGIVYQGDIIGYLGTSGNSTGPHCHTEVWKLDGDSWEEVLSREYSSSFNNGWGSLAINNACEYTEDVSMDPGNENYLGACRLKAYELFGQAGPGSNY